MPSRLRISLLFVLAALTLGLVACGGEDAAEEDPNALLEETFAGDHQVDSGRLDVRLQVNTEGEEIEGPINLRLAGPFETTEEDQPPRFQFEVTAEGGGQSLAAGATSTGERGFVRFQGTDFELSEQMYQQFSQSYQQAQQITDEDEQANDCTLSNLGIDPRGWLENPQNQGEADVGGDEAIRITGDVQLPQLLDDVNRSLECARQINLEGATGEIPTELTDEQREQIEEAVESVSVEVFTGADDRILRRLLVNLNVQPPENSEVQVDSAEIVFDLQISGVNDDQEITEPENAQPLDQLLGQMGGLGLGGGLGEGQAPGGEQAPEAQPAPEGQQAPEGEQAPPGDEQSGGAISPETLEEYSECVRQADDDAAAQRCQEILNP